MSISFIRGKIVNFYARIRTSNNLAVSGNNTLSASIRALFVVFFLFFLSSGSTKAANSVNFIIDSSYDSNARSQITASNRATGINAYYYIEDAYWNNLSSSQQTAISDTINSLATEFDNVIYPKMRAMYGEEWNPGIDNDPRIYILFTNIVKDAGGYYNPNDEYYRSLVKDGRSNEKEIIYLNTEFLGKSSQRSFLAHEFQHMINWHHKKKISNVDEDIWLNEGLSEYTSTLLGYDIPYYGSVIELRVNAFKLHSSDSLTEWQNINQDYASVNLFMQYLVDHYGIGMLKEIINSDKTGIASINDALQSLNYNTNFSQVFSDWEVANYLNDKKIYNNKYSYGNPVLLNYNLVIKPTETIVVKNKIPIKNIEYTKDWSGKWLEFTSPLGGAVQTQALEIVFTAASPAENFKIPYIVKNIDGTVVVGEIQLDSQQNGTVLFDNFNTKVASVVIIPISEKKTSEFTQSESLVRFSYSVALAKMNVPIISNITPTSAPVNGGVLATIIGENFNANSIVKFGGVPAEIQIPDSKTIIAKIPPSTVSGNVSVEVFNSASSSATASQIFSYVALPSDGSLVRAIGDYKVYVVSGKYKRWIQSPEIFKYYPHFGWNAIVPISPQTRDYYATSHLIRAAGDSKVYEVNSDNSKHHMAITAAQFTASGRSWEMVFIINNQERNFYKTGSTITK